ncbi:MAG: hypothetical protein CVU55_02860 [Deltaproteobacteria bacterium HGW-Deltaproteobacteria-13]|jgi:PAS domain S-box-containing protein|nr:MAG: hypothetical protein CVU55_02860 [Deltaproteobacteria bacterium HGW-Deltaproteobacteria-13]
MMIHPRYRSLLVAAAYFAGGYLGLSIPYVGSHITLIWPPTGIALAALIHWGYGTIPGIWLGAFLVNLATGASWEASLGISVGNVLGPFVAWLLLRRAGFDRRMDKRSDVLSFVFAGAVLPMIISATIGTLTLTITKLLPLTNWSTAWFAWWWGDLLGVLLFTPPLISFDRKAVRAVWTDIRTGGETLLAAVLLIASGIIIFFSSLPLGLPRQMDLLPAIFLIWIAAIGDIWFTSLCILLVGAMAALSTALGSGPFTRGNVNDNLVWLWIYLAGFTVIGLIVAAISSGYRRAQRELTLGKRRLELALQGGDLGYWDVDFLTNHMMVNDRWAQMLETSLTELTPSPRDVWLAALYPEDRNHVLAAEEAYREGRSNHFEIQYRVITRGGNIRWQLSRGAAIERDKNGKVIFMVGTVMDITDAQETFQTLITAKEQAESADRLKSAFLASMSHELRTPLNSIIGFTGMLLQGIAGSLNQEQTKQLGMVRGSARHLLNLINDILDISKIESGQLHITSEIFDLRKSIEKTVQTISPLARKKNIRLRSKIDDNVSEMRGDQRRVEQIILNLLSNAVKFTEEGEINLSCHADNNLITLSVEDTGMGIKPENIDIIFDAFLQLDTGLTRVKEGTGLGLNITKKLVEMMGGSIRVESEFGKGSHFTIVLPET